MVTMKLMLISYAILAQIEAYKILVIITYPGKSHGILGDAMVDHLLRGGHQVTYITPFPIKTRENLTLVDVSNNSRILDGDVLNIENMMRGEVDLQSGFLLMDLSLEFGEATLIDPNVQKMLGDRQQNFDLIISEWLFNELVAGFAAVYECPFIWLSSLEPHWMVLRLIDEKPNSAYVSGPASNKSPPLSFLERIEELISQLYGTWIQYSHITPLEDKYYEKYLVPHIRNKNKPTPSLTELKHNASLMFGNSHVSLGGAIKLPQNYIPIGGYHIETNTKPLPNNLQKLLDESKYGVIYFSMGSNLKSKDLPKKITREILKVLGELKQTVIWKFETDLPDRPKNVHIVHWAPQQSILAHKNILFFISHGGLLSTTEAVHFGVPMISIPVMVDQYANADRAVRKGFAIKVDLSYTMEKDLKKAIQIMLTESKFATKAKELSYIYHSRAITPHKEILHWVELVVQTRGALHLRSPALHMPWYQKIYLDLIALILVVAASIIILLNKVTFIVNKDTTRKLKIN